MIRRAILGISLQKFYNLDAALCLENPLLWLLEAFQVLTNFYINYFQYSFGSL
jgi:hypothetical protein